MKIAILDIATLGEDIVLDPVREVGETEEYKTTAPEDISLRHIHIFACQSRMPPMQIVYPIG